MTKYVVSHVQGECLSVTANKQKQKTKQTKKNDFKYVEACC